MVTNSGISKCYKRKEKVFTKKTDKR